MWHAVYGLFCFEWLIFRVDFFPGLKEKLSASTVVDYYRVPFADWDHLDFIWGVDANKYLYPEVEKVLLQYGRMRRTARRHREEQPQENSPLLQQSLE